MYEKFIGTHNRRFLCALSPAAPPPASSRANDRGVFLSRNPSFLQRLDNGALFGDVLSALLL